MADPVRRGGTAAVAGLTTTSPAGTQVGDLVLVYTFERLGTGSASTLTLDGSMGRELCNLFHNDGSTDGALGVAAVIATSAGAQSYQGFTSSVGTETATGCEVVEAGTFDPTLANIRTATPVTATGTGVPNPPSVGSLDTGRAHYVAAISAWHMSSASAWTPTAPTNYTNLTHISASLNRELACSSRILSAGPSSEDPGTYGDSITPNGTCSFTLAVQGSVLPTLEDGSEEWSGAAGKSGALISAKLAIGAVAVAAGIAHGLLQQADDLPRAPQIQASESIEVIAVGRDPLPMVFIADDDIVPQPVAAILEVGESPVFRITRAQVPRPSWSDEDLPVRVALEESLWLELESRAIDVNVVGWPITGGTGVAPAAAVELVDETQWQPPTVVRTAWPIAAAWSVADDLPVVAPLDESLWSHQPSAPRPFLVLWQDLDGLVVPQPAAFVPEEDYWFQPAARRIAVEVVSWPVTGGLGAPASVADFVDDTYWQPHQPVVRKPIDTVWRVDDELPPAAADIVPVGSSAQRAVHKPVVLRWFGEDQFPQQAAPSPAFDETAWSVDKPLLRAAVVRLWGDEDFPQQAAPTPVWDETAAVLERPLQAAAVQRLWSGDDEFPQQAPAPALDESVWLMLEAAESSPVCNVWTLPDEIAYRAPPLEWDWQVYVPEPLRPHVTLFKDEQIAMPGWVVPPVYDWGARGRIGGLGRDPWGRIGSAVAQQENHGVGSEVAVDPHNGIGSEQA